jgi:alpha-L-glutamate ligase-like protein
VWDYDFEKIESSFVIKPSSGSGGRGIMIVRKRAKVVGEWMGAEGNRLQAEDLRLHISDILEGQYSTVGVDNKAFVEERVPIHPKFRKYVHKGTPDIRVIVYNRVPVMAMLRLPTKESEGRANLHQGAIGLGVDMATGVTLKGVCRGKAVKYVPNSKRKLNGLKIPQWGLILKTAAAAAEAADLVYGGVDLLLHPEKGPMVVELNASPGLDIQLANKAGLKWRLERVEGIKIKNPEHGVRVGKALFAEYFSDKVKADEGVVIVDNFEIVKLRGMDKKYVEVEAMVDTGAYRSSLDEKVAEELGLLDEKNVLWERGYASSLGSSRRKVIGLTYYLKGRRVKTAVSVANRSRRKTKMLVGRLDLSGFMVNPQMRKR